MRVFFCPIQTFDDVTTPSQYLSSGIIRSYTIFSQIDTGQVNVRISETITAQY